MACIGQNGKGEEGKSALDLCYIVNVFFLWFFVGLQNLEAAFSIKCFPLTGVKQLSAVYHSAANVT